MAKIFTHDCKVCKTETEHHVQTGTYNLHVTCKVCNHSENIPYTNEYAKERALQDCEQPKQKGDQS